jgi:hypothetical protein
MTIGKWKMITPQNFSVSAYHDFSAVAIKLDPLNIESARRQPQMPPLMGLISVQPAPRLSLAFHIFSFLN